MVSNSATATLNSDDIETVKKSDDDRDSENLIWEQKTLVNRQSERKERSIPLPGSLREMILRTPRSLWKTTPVRLILTFEARKETLSNSLSKYNPEYMKRLPLAIIDTTLDSFEDLQTIPGVSGVYLDELIPLDRFALGSPLAEGQEGIATYPSESIIGARYLQDLGVNGSGVTIAVLDTGIDSNHPDLDDLDNDDSTDDPKVILEASFIDFDEDGLNDTSPMGDHFHGTHVAGIAAGNGLLKGVAPGATLMNGKVLDANFGGRTSWIVKGMDWAIQNGADIISMSLGGLPGDASPLFEAAANAAWSNGTIVVASAGNDGPSPGTISSPGLESRTITVGASNIYNDVGFFSSRGPALTGTVDPDITAPGRGILSLKPKGGYITASGTSMAAPAVSGVLALLISGDPNATLSELRSALLSTATDLGRHVFTQGAGLVNASAAYQLLKSQDLNVYAYPSFSNSSPLVLSPGERYDYQLDLFLNHTFGSLNLTPSANVKPHVNVSLIDSGLEGWIRARINVTGPLMDVTGVLMVNDGPQNYYNATLSMVVDREENDGGSGTDAGETFAGALSISLGVPIDGEAFKWDKDLYSISVVQDQAYSAVLSNMTENLNLFISDETGNIFNASRQPGIVPEEILFKAYSTGDYYIKIEGELPGKYSMLVRASSESEIISSPPAYLTGNMWSHPVDNDLDGLGEELVFSIEVNVSKAGKYNFWYSVAQNRPDYFFGRYVFVWDLLNFTLQSGLQNLTISIPGGLLQSSGFNGSYIINELAFGKYGFSLLLFYGVEVFTTPVQYHSSFEALNNRLKSHMITEKDIDGDGTPETIQIRLEFEFSRRGSYAVSIPVLNENQNEVLAANGTTFGVSRLGITQVSVEFMAQQFGNQNDIVLFGIAGSWFRYLIPIYYRITKSNLKNFDSTIEFTIGDRPVDTNKTGKVDVLRFVFVITSKINTTMELFTGHPFSLSNETMILVNSAEKNATLEPGLSVIEIDFDLRVLRGKNLHGPYFFPNLGFSLPEGLGTYEIPYITQDYRFSSLEQPPQRFEAFYGGTPYAFEYDAGIEVTWRVTSLVQAKVIFEFVIWEYEPREGEFRKTITFTRKVSVGTFNVSFKLTSEDLYYSKYVGGLEIYTASIYSFGIENRLQHRFQEHNLSLVDFTFHAGILPSVNFNDYAKYMDFYFVSKPEMRFQDFDQNKVYEGFELNSTVHVDEPGKYQVVVVLYSRNDYLWSTIRDQIQLYVSGEDNYTVSFFFNAKTLVRKGFDRIVYGNLSIRRDETGQQIEIMVPHFRMNKSQLSYSSAVQFGTIVAEHEFDRDGDGNWDGVQVETMLSSTQEGSYEISFGAYSQLGDYLEMYLGNITLSNVQLQLGSQGVNFTIPYYYFLAIFQEAEKLAISAEIEIILVPIFGLDSTGLFLISDKPYFLTKTYDLNDFNMNLPFSFSSVKISQNDGDEDKQVDSVEISLKILVNDLIPFSIHAQMDFFWSNYKNSLDYEITFNPKSTGTIDSVVMFGFAEAFTYGNTPEKYSIGAELNLVSFDGITIDTYLTPVRLHFETGAVNPSNSTTTDVRLPSLTPGFTEFIVVSLLVLSMSTALAIVLRQRSRS